MKGLAVAGAMKLSLLLRDRVKAEVFDRYERILSRDWTQVGIAEAEEWLCDPDVSMEEEEIADPAVIARLMRTAGSNAVARTLLELLALREVEAQTGEVLEIVNPGNGSGVTLLTAARAAGYTGAVEDAIPAMLDAEEILRFLIGIPEKTADRFYCDIYRPDSYLYGILTGHTIADRGYADFSETGEPSDDAPACYGMEAEVKALTGELGVVLKKQESGDGGIRRPVTVLITGEHESGRYTAVRAISHGLSLRLLSVEHSYLLGTEEPKEVLRRLVRACALEERCLVIRHIIPHKDTVFLIERLQQLYGRHCHTPLFLLTVPEVKLIPVLRGDHLSMRIPAGDTASMALWKGYLPKKLKKLAEPLASKMHLTAGQVRRVTAALSTMEAVGGEPDERSICRLCYEVLDDGRYDNVKRVEPGFTLDDLKIDAHNRSVLTDICRQVELRHRVYDDWGLKKRYAYGRCVSVILAGPPGTGKTMTVHALAGQLGLELYKVDLSQIVDKYIGETEKRLEEVFTRAQKSNMILFFDEADAVMGKRSEVKEAKDKYANTEISFILQRIEEYDGIVLLATNNLQNIDQAFMRRIRYVLSFQLPDKETRKEIWRSAFGEGVPVSDDIDYDFLAEKFELSGGEIKNIVLNAVFYGASEDGEVAMRHIMKAVYRENTKLKRIAFDGDYGGYAYLLHD